MGQCIKGLEIKQEKKNTGPLPQMIWESRSMVEYLAVAESTQGVTQSLLPHCPHPCLLHSSFLISPMLGELPTTPVL